MWVLGRDPRYTKAQRRAVVEHLSPYPRGALALLGGSTKMHPKEIQKRANFCDDNNIITDFQRNATLTGRIFLCSLLFIV